MGCHTPPPPPPIHSVNNCLLARLKINRENSRTIPGGGKISELLVKDRQSQKDLSDSMLICIYDLCTYSIISCNKPNWTKCKIIFPMLPKLFQNYWILYYRIKVKRHYPPPPLNPFSRVILDFALWFGWYFPVFWVPSVTAVSPLTPNQPPLVLSPRVIWPVERAAKWHSTLLKHINHKGQVRVPVYSISSVSCDKCLQHGLFNYIDTRRKCCHLKKPTCKGTLRQVFICLRPPSPHNSSIPTPFQPQTVCLYCTLTKGGGGGGGESWTREKARGATVQKTGLKIPS
jgi:hypothetical protein